VDCMGCLLAGMAEPVASHVARLAPQVPTRAAPMLAPLACGGYAAPADAALLHGTAAHALDYDDTNHPAYAHPSAVLLPALLAVAPLTPATGADIVSAYIVGFEMFGKLGRALNTAHYIKGWHATCTFGALAAALAVGRLLGLNAQKLATATAIAASMAGGVRANFGTMVKPFHAGLAARAGVEAALLAQGGFDAASDAIEHRFGYLEVFAGAEPPAREWLSRPGDPLEILTEYGLALKPYPACGATHPGIEAATRLHKRLLPGETIETVRVGISEMALNPLIHARPKMPLEGKFSMHFTAAAALVQGHVSLETFTQAVVDDPAIAAMIDRMVVEVDERVAKDPEFATAIEIRTNTGRVDEELVPLAIGKPARWMPRKMIAHKFMDCVKHANIQANAPAVLDLLWTLDSNTPARDFAEAFAMLQSDPSCSPAKERVNESAA